MTDQQLIAQLLGAHKRIASITASKHANALEAIDEAKQIAAAAFATAIEARVNQNDPALRLVADIRFALGDDGKRMSDELVEYCRELRKDAERYRWLLENYATGDGYDLIDDALNSGEADVYLSAAIDTAMQTQAPTGA